MSHQQEHWAVTVYRNGESIVTIESHCLSGRELSANDERVVHIAGTHLLAFVAKQRDTSLGPFGPRWADDLQARIRALMARSEQDRRFGPAVVRRAVNDAICGVLNPRSDEGVSPL